LYFTIYNGASFSMRLSEVITERAT